MYTSRSEGPTSATRLMYDLNLSYKFKGGGWVAGGTYQGDSSGAVGQATGGRTSYGATAGWVAPKEMGPFLLGTYFISSTVGSLKGSGYQFDLGYKVTIGRIPVAFQMSYKKYSYSGGQLSQGFIDPYLAVLFTL
jgi:hypothetical protein